MRRRSNRRDAGTQPCNAADFSNGLASIEAAATEACCAKSRSPDGSHVRSDIGYDVTVTESEVMLILATMERQIASLFKE